VREGEKSKRVRESEVMNSDTLSQFKVRCVKSVLFREEKRREEKREEEKRE